MEDISMNSVFGCNGCNTPLVKEVDRIARPSFRAFYGPGYLFHNAINIAYGEPYERQMTTGMHTIRDLMCAKCNQYVGWVYEKAEKDSESYKVGKFLLEGASLVELGKSNILSKL